MASRWVSLTTAPSCRCFQGLLTIIADCSLCVTLCAVAEAPTFGRHSAVFLNEPACQCEAGRWVGGCQFVLPGGIVDEIGQDCLAGGRIDAGICTVVLLESVNLRY